VFCRHSCSGLSSIQRRTTTTSSLKSTDHQVDDTQLACGPGDPATGRTVLRRWRQLAVARKNCTTPVGRSGDLSPPYRIPPRRCRSRRRRPSPAANSSGVELPVARKAEVTSSVRSAATSRRRRTRPRRRCTGPGSRSRRPAPRWCSRRRRRRRRRRGRATLTRWWSKLPSSPRSSLTHPTRRTLEVRRLTMDVCQCCSL